MAWRLARGLEKLRSEVNEAWPKRSKASDGTIGDARHSAQKSDHNPDASCVVRALEITDDPGSASHYGLTAGASTGPVGIIKVT